MVQIECPECAADLNVPASSPIHTCDYCGSAIQISQMIDSGAETGATEDQKKQFIIQDHYIIRCKYNHDQVKSLLVDWVQKIPGAPQDFEGAANINRIDLKFYPLWVGEIAATSDYVGLDDWPRFSKPAHDRPGWYEHVSYYKREESGRVIREYQVPIMALDIQKLPKYLRTYNVTTTGKEFFDITHCKKLGGEIVDSIYTMDQADKMVRQEALNKQTNEMHKEVKKITSRNDDIQQKGLFYIHFPIYEISFNYNGKPHDALVDGSSGRIVHVKVPVSKEFRVKTLSASAAFGVVGTLMIALGSLEYLMFFNIAGGIGLIIVALMFLGLNLRKKASERQK
ncbi:hypothetical protein GF325_11770 [Candidatus Bathyarchaeota archaeon]|nr:hypothetical protein [Candidatus Bathyarchaeota archaeon]